jgi:signal transduction histidine kinase
VAAQQRIDEEGERKARRAALWVSVSYLTISGLYILISGEIVRAVASDVEELARLEKIKGLSFMLAVSLGLGVAAWHWVRSRHKRKMELLRQREALLKAEHRAQSGLLASALTHDFNNVLLAMMMGIYELEETPLSEDQREVIEQLKVAASQGRHMTEQLRLRVKERVEGKRVELAPQLFLQEVIAMTTPLMKQRGVALELVSSDCERWISADEMILHRAISNMIINAADAAGRGGHVQVRCVGEEGGCALEIHDDGPGFSDQVLHHAAEAFYTTKETGTGLGLFSVRVCAEQHGGALEIGRSELLGGACVRLKLPWV